MVNRPLIITAALALGLAAQEQAPIEVHGDLQTDFQYYTPVAGDSTSVPDAKTGSNSYLNFQVTRSPFAIGGRFELYEPAMVGFDPRYKGLQIAQRYARYSSEPLSVTLGTFYEQYGSGLVLRAYNDWNLGYDNALDGVRLASAPWQGVTLKGLIGVQRLYGTTGPGIVRGADGEIQLSQAFPIPAEIPSLTLGGSFVSKYQKASHPSLNLPANVAAGAGRATLTWGIATLGVEHAYKINDPGETNGYIYKEGQATLVNLSLTARGIGLSLSGRRADNMDFRSDRGATGSDLLINHLPPLTPQFTYSLAAMYPYLSRPNGELAGQVDLVCKAPAGFPLGLGGTRLWLNYSRSQDLARKPAANPHMGYTSPPAGFSDTLLYQGANVEVSRTFGPQVSAALSVIAQQRNDGVLKLSDYHGTITALTAVLDLGWVVADGQVIKGDIEHLYTAEDKGSWAAGTLEYEWNGLFVTVRDDWNYGNADAGARDHYPGIGAGYTYNTIRASLSYGRTRAGVVCAGGVCRLMPSVSGLAFTVTASF